ncbi:hypothetical protein [Sulfurovum sp.]|uniref:hypothetical protein n=1 Tax=Sulfurovum sp. TaxID=1969726 RepID=UPI002868024A|nr:hypothetical protein [Sulfurovum sp.]
MYKSFFLILFSVSSLLALSPSDAKSRIAIGYNPADVTVVIEGKSFKPDFVLMSVEEELTNSNCSNDNDGSYILVETENPEAMKKYRETIEKENSNENIDPYTLLTPRFIAATHLLKGSVITDNGCAMVNLRIEDRKGCVRAQKKISVSGMSMWQEVEKLITEATSSLRYQICNSMSNEQTCSKSHYTDELFCPHYYTMRTVVKKIEKQEPPVKTGGRNSDLTTVTLKDTKQVIYIDTIKGKILNVPFVKETSVKKTSEKYKLNTSSCQYEVVEKVEELPYHKSSFAYLNNPSSSLSFTKDTILDLQISGISGKEIKVPWHRLKESGHFSDSTNWRKKKTQIEKDTEVNNMLKLNAKGQALIPKLKEVSDFGIAVEQALGQDAIETKCQIQREFYDVLENGANIAHPKISYRYQVSINQVSKSDIEKAKEIIERMENYSGSYTEEKQLYDGLNNPLYAPKKVEDKKSSLLEKEPRGILDTLLPENNSDTSKELSMDDLEMFTK